MVIVGTGLGGGAVIDGRPTRGREGRAGHVGHILLPEYAFRHPHDRTLKVGNALATAESAISLTGLTHQLEHRLTLDDWKDHPLNDADGTAKDKAKRLREFAAEGDALACELFDDQARALGIALLNANYLGDYDRVVIGGGVCDLSPSVRDRYREIAEASYREYALERLPQPRSARVQRLRRRGAGHRRARLVYGLAGSVQSPQSNVFFFRSRPAVVRRRRWFFSAVQ